MRNRRAWRVGAAIALDDELLVVLRRSPPDEERWFHSQTSVPAVILLSRWRDAGTPIEVIHDERGTVLRPGPTDTGLRFRDQAPKADVDVLLR